MLSMPGKRDAAESDIESGVGKRGVERTGKSEAARDPRGLRGLPCEEACLCCGRQGRREEMHAGPAFAGVEAETHGGVGVVGDCGALVEVKGGVGFPRGDHLNAASGEQGTQPDAESEIG